MQKLGINWGNSIFTRLVVTFLLIMLPFYFLGIAIFNWSRDMLSNEIFKSMQAQVTFYLNGFDKEISHIRKLQYECLENQDMNTLAVAPQSLTDFERTKTINRIQGHIINIKNSSDYIQSVRAYFPSISKIINTPTIGRGSIDDMNDDIYDVLKKVPFDNESQLLYLNDKILLTTAFPYQDISRGSPRFVIEVELSKTAIKNTLLKSNINENVGSILEIPSQKLMLTNEKDSGKTNKLLETINKYYKKNKSGSVSMQIDGKQYLLFYVSSDYSSAIMARYVPESKVFEQLKKYQLWYWAFSLLALIIIVFYSFSTYRYIQKPLLRLVKSLNKVKNGDFDITIQHGYKDEFRYLYECFNQMVENIKVLIDQVYKQKILMQKAELKQLQSQINPHFLYNSFFILQRRIGKGDYENAMSFCDCLGTYFKFITRSASDEVTLSKEVEHARIYADIQAARFSNRIKVDFEGLPVDFENLMVPRLILQPIIENAFEHGLEDKEENGLLRITFKDTDNILIISIEDNGDRLKASELDGLKSILNGEADGVENTGIINIHKRIRLAKGANSGISVDHGELGGLRVEIRLEMRGNS